MGEVVIRVERLSKAFRAPRGLLALTARTQPARVVLSDVSFTVARGEVVGLVGPNGSGKTTLLEILATYLLPTRGHAWVNGFDVVREPDGARRSVGYAAGGGRDLDPWLSGPENLELFAVVRGRTSPDANRRLAALCELAGLDAAGATPVGRYSDGMRQRLALVRALSTDAPVLLLDEPTRSLDAETASRFRALFRQLCGADGKGILLVSHDRHEVREVCDRIIATVPLAAPLGAASSR